MESSQFDSLAKAIATRSPRRGLLRILSGGILATAGMGRSAQQTSAFALHWHERLTRFALQGLAEPDAIDEIVGNWLLGTGNLGTDGFFDANVSNPNLHFDGRNTPSDFCTAWRNSINTYLNRAVDAARPICQGGKVTGVKDRRKALQDFGRAIHALQDFYAHSNWVELGNRGTAPLLGPSCREADFGGGLMTGFYSLEWIVTGGCPPSGPPRGYRTCHRELNKDDFGSPASQRICFGAVNCGTAARDLAAQATRDAWAAFRKRLDAKWGAAGYNASCLGNKLAWESDGDCGCCNRAGCEPCHDCVKSTCKARPGEQECQGGCCQAGFFCCGRGCCKDGNDCAPVHGTDGYLCCSPGRACDVTCCYSNQVCEARTGDYARRCYPRA